MAGFPKKFVGIRKWAANDTPFSKRLSNPLVVGASSGLSAENVNNGCLSLKTTKPAPNAEYGYAVNETGLMTIAVFMNCVLPRPLAKAFGSPSSVFTLPAKTANFSERN